MLEEPPEEGTKTDAQQRLDAQRRLTQVYGSWNIPVLIRGFAVFAAERARAEAEAAAAEEASRIALEQQSTPQAIGRSALRRDATPDILWI